MTMSRRPSAMRTRNPLILVLLVVFATRTSSNALSAWWLDGFGPSISYYSGGALRASFCDVRGFLTFSPIDPSILVPITDHPFEGTEPAVTGWVDEKGQPKIIVVYLSRHGNISYSIFTCNPTTGVYGAGTTTAQITPDSPADSSNPALGVTRFENKTLSVFYHGKDGQLHQTIKHDSSKSWIRGTTFSTNGGYRNINLAVTINKSFMALGVLAPSGQLDVYHTAGLGMSDDSVGHSLVVKASRSGKGHYERDDGANLRLALTVNDPNSSLVSLYYLDYNRQLHIVTKGSGSGSTHSQTSDSSDRTLGESVPLAYSLDIAAVNNPNTANVDVFYVGAGQNGQQALISVGCSAEKVVATGIVPADAVAQPTNGIATHSILSLAGGPVQATQPPGDSTSLPVATATTASISMPTDQPGGGALTHLTPSAPTSPSSNGSGHEFSAGTEAAIVICTLLAVVLVGCLVYWVWRHWRLQRQLSQDLTWIMASCSEKDDGGMHHPVSRQQFDQSSSKRGNITRDDGLFDQHFAPSFRSGSSCSGRQSLGLMLPDSGGDYFSHIRPYSECGRLKWDNELNRTLQGGSVDGVHRQDSAASSATYRVEEGLRSIQMESTDGEREESIIGLDMGDSRGGRLEDDWSDDGSRFVGMAL